MIDSHAHLGLCEEGSEELVSSAHDAGVSRILTIGTEEASNEEALTDARRFGEVFAAVGRHPNRAEGFDDAAAARIRELTGEEQVRAVGETGLDFYRNGAPREDQRRAFAAQIEISAETGLPLVIHVRDRRQETEAIDEVFETLAGHPSPVILHCFSEPSRAAEAVRRGWYCSFAGNLTYPAASSLREAAAGIPEDLILVETDSPYLSPQPVRGKPNRPANVVATAAVLAEARGSDPSTLEPMLDRNAARLFGW